MHIDNQTLQQIFKVLADVNLHLDLLSTVDMEPLGSMKADNVENALAADQVRQLRRKLHEILMSSRQSVEPCGGCGDCRENNGENCSNPQ